MTTDSQPSASAFLQPTALRWRRLCQAAAVVAGLTLAAAPYASASPTAHRPAGHAAVLGATHPGSVDAPTVVRHKTAVINVTGKKQFDELLATHPKVIAMFTAHWCGPCRHIQPEYDRLSMDNGLVTFAAIDFDVDGNQELATEYGVRSLPTFMTFHQKQRDEVLVGASPDKLREIVRNLAAA